MISFNIFPRAEPPGRTSIVLQLYRHDKLISMTTIAVVPITEAAAMMQKCSVHLGRLGVQRVNWLQLVA